MSAVRPFSLMVKPVGSRCNLECSYCYYLGTKLDVVGCGDGGGRMGGNGVGGSGLSGSGIGCSVQMGGSGSGVQMGGSGSGVQIGGSGRMSDDVLERFIRQYIYASQGPNVNFVWHGGEPTIAGLDFYRKAVEIQKRCLPQGWACWNNLQTNGTLLDAEWCAFMAEEGFDAGVSIDGTRLIHDRYRKDKRGNGTYDRVVAAVRLLQEHGIQPDLLCTVTSDAAMNPLAVYRALRELDTKWIQFIPIVRRLRGEGVPVGSAGKAQSSGASGDSAEEAQSSGAFGDLAADASVRGSGSSSMGASGVSLVTPDSVTGELYGEFLCAVFDEWLLNDLGSVEVQLFAEAAHVWAGGEAGLCWMAPTCGRVLVVEQDGGVYSCDHFVAPEHKIGDISADNLSSLANLPAQIKFGDAKRDALPKECRECEWLLVCNGGCPKDRFELSNTGEPGLNYLCGGLKRFFSYARPAVDLVSALTQRGQSPAEVMAYLRARLSALWKNVGRNDPCPCGSGKKAKNCCWSKRV